MKRPSNDLQWVLSSCRSTPKERKRLHGNALAAWKRLLIARNNRQSSLRNFATTHTEAPAAMEKIKEIASTIELDESDAELLSGLIEGLLRGFDMQKQLGIKPRRGTSQFSDSGNDYAIASAYHLLVAGGELKKAASLTVAAHFNTSESNVRRVAKIYEDSILSYILKRSDMLGSEPKQWCIGAAADARFTHAVRNKKLTQKIADECLAAGADALAVGMTTKSYFSECN